MNVADQLTSTTPQVPVAPNPLVTGIERLPVHPTSVVIFGATGDLSRRKLMPAFYNLAHDGSLPLRFSIIGVARSEHSDDDFRHMVAEAVRRFSRRRPDEQVLQRLLEQVFYVPGSFDDPHVYTGLQEALDAREEEAGEPLNRCFYLATAPHFFGLIVRMLGEWALNRHPGAEVRLVVEKPFGTTLAEARQLNREVTTVFDESQVFRIDHYLGKETVQNLLALRFANYIFEPVWNRNYVDNIQITAAEDLGIEARGSYYDATGALRDLVQNHMLQLLCLVAMEPPVHFRADEVRTEKVKVLHAIDPPPPDDISKVAVRGQYSRGIVAGDEVPGYLEEDGVPSDSTTETFAALRLQVDNWRWKGVPFYLRTGKRMVRKLSEIAITLKPVPHLAFEQEGSLGVQPNQLVLTLQPNEGVSLSLVAKIPGPRMVMRPVKMEYLYGTSFLSQAPEAYERLILDVMRGDAMLFTRADEVEAQWRIVDPILQAWQRDPGPLPQYPAGSRGPEEADRILLPGDSWRPL